MTVLVVEYFAIPQIVHARDDLQLFSDAAPLVLALALGLEVASLTCYTSLTRVVLPAEFRPRFVDQFRIDLTGLGASHVVPGGGASAAALRFRLMTTWGIPASQAAATTAVQTALAVIGLIATFAAGVVLIGPAVLEEPIYAAAGVGALTVLMGVALAVRAVSRRPGREAVRRLRTADTRHGPTSAHRRGLRWLAGLLERALETVATTARRAGVLLRTPRDRLAVFGWAGGNWLLDAASLWVCLWAYGVTLHPGVLLAAYGAANLMGLVPITPGGLGVVEGVLIPALIALGGAAAAPVALGVLTWRLFEFWLPIPVAGLAYLSLRVHRREPLEHPAGRPPRSGPRALLAAAAHEQADSMTTTTLSHHDHLIQEDVMEELAWAPQVTDAHVGVSVLDGAVTLSGEVDTFTERVEAKKAALRVKGVTVVANDLAIRDGGRFKHTDSDIAAAIQHVLDWATDVPKDVVQAEVRDRTVVLTGTVEWNYQRKAAERLARGVIGVLQVDNQIALTPRVSGQKAAQLIKDALVRHALQDASSISVSTTGSEVTLTGHVSTWAEKIDAGHAAWSSPHASAVHNRIVIRP